MIVSVMGVLLNAFYIVIYRNIDKTSLINGLISILLLIVVSRHMNRMSLDEELLCEDMYYLKKKNMSDEEIKLYLLKKYGKEIYEKVFKNDSSKNSQSS